MFSCAGYHGSRTRLPLPPANTSTCPALPPSRSQQRVCVSAVVRARVQALLLLLQELSSSAQNALLVAKDNGIAVLLACILAHIKDEARRRVHACTRSHTHTHTHAHTNARACARIDAGHRHR
eukprot:6111137-Pleurochrysis_carterae.AAC.1